MIRAAYRLLSYCAGLSILTIVLCSSALAAGATGRSDLAMQAEDEKAVTWTLNADKVTSLSANEVIEAEGNVVLQRGGEYLKADYARYYAGTKWVFLRGNVSARMGRDDMKADEAEFDLRSRVGWLKRGQIFMDGPHMYFAGERIDKHWGDVYSFKEAKVTACDGDVPAWSLEADEAVVEIDGYAQLWRPKFQVKDTPVLFSPWMVLPAKKERQTGFLTPEYGTSSKRGFYYNQPFFWAIDESQDMTLNEYYMEKRGLMQGVEYRTRPSVRETGWIRLDWLNDKVTDSSGDHYNSGDGLSRSNADRYWVRGMYEGFLADPKWKIRADLDYVSDQDMLHEFKSGYSGYNRSRDELFNMFRRDIQEKDLARQSGVMLFRDWDRVSVALSSTYTQDQTLGHGNAPKSSDTTVQRVPQLDLFLHKGGIIDTLPLEIAASAETGYMYRRDGTRGMRYTMTPYLSVPINGKYGSLMATAGVQQAFYGTDTYSKTDPEDDRQTGKSQTIPTFQADGSTEFSRVFKLGGASLAPTKENTGKSQWTAVQHAIQPRVRYRNVPLEDQHRNPNYDSKDRIRAANELTYSVANILTRKRERVTAQKPAKEGEEPTPVVTTDYLEFVRFSLEQSYDLREATRTDEREEYERRPFRDVIAELQISFDEYISLISRTYWSPYEERITSHDHGVSFRYATWGSLYTGIGFRDTIDEYLRERNHKVKTLKLAGDINLYGPFAMAFSYDHDYERNESADKSFSLIYNHQCFKLEGIFRQDGYDTSYGFRISLSGLGD
ncbi:Organic solvent tolerance protein [uncultured delta proteobacterium]|uniref:Organic solvent tolerance protein n=1 Tax=uncultured delta proteobacterium TaxID=34034 RepID=A0A212KEY7_9DELT|nr:Organic solvent tolerance protein [uncultured delta proteobacterium]